MLPSDGGPMGVPDDADLLDPEVLQTRAIFDAARAGLLASVSGSREAIDLARAQRLLDALAAARVLAEDAEDRVLLQRSLLTPAEAERRAAARRLPDRRQPAQRQPAQFQPAQRRPGAANEGRGADEIRSRPAVPPVSPPVSPPAASALVRVVLPAVAALAGAALARHGCCRCGGHGRSRTP